MCKRITLLLSLIVAATVSIMAVTNLWSGSTYLEGNEIEVSNDAMGSLSVGDQIKVSFTNTEEGEIKISIDTDNGTATLFEDYHVAAGAGSVAFDVTETFINGYQKSRKFKLMAKKLTITSVDAIEGEGGGDEPDPEQPEQPENPDDGTFSGVAEIQGLTFQMADNWYDVAVNGADATKALWIKPAYMPAVQAGDEIRVYFAYDGGQANFVFLDSDNNWNKRGDNNSTDPDWIDYISGNTAYTFKIQSDARAAEMAANGLWVDGKQNSVVKVEFVYNKHAEEVGEIVADDQPEPPVEEGNFTTRVLWKEGETITSAKGDDTSLVFDSNWMSRYGLQDGDADRLDQAFHIPASKFYTAGADDTNADLDDCIVVTYKSANPQGQASFYFKDNDGVWFKRGCGDSNTVVDAYNVDGKVFYRYILNYRMVAALRHNGLWIDGNNGSEIEKVELRNYSNKALDDSFPYFVGTTKQDLDPTKGDRGYVVNDEGGNREFGWNNMKRIRPVAFTNYANGERIVFTLKKTADNALMRLQFIRPYSANMKVAQGLTGTEEGILEVGAADDNGLVDVVYRPTQREIRALKFNGLFLDGEGLELVEISFGEENPGDMQNDLYVHNDWMTLGHDDEGKVYEGDLYTSDNVHIYVSHTHFKRAAENDWLAVNGLGRYEGYRLTFHFPWSGGARMSLTYDPDNISDINRDPLNWYYEAAYGSGLATAGLRAPGDDVPAESGTYYDIDDIPAGQNVYYNQPLTHEDVTNLLNYGMWIHGGNADLQSVLLRSPISVSGVDSAVEDELMDAVIDLNAPYEAYTIDGRRVADIEAPGLYILRQGNKVVKMMRR